MQFPSLGTDPSALAMNQVNSSLTWRGSHLTPAPFSLFFPLNEGLPLALTPHSIPSAWNYKHTPKKHRA